MIRAVIFDCFGVLFADPVLAYRHDGKTPEHIVAALQDIDDRASNGELSKEMYIERAAQLLNLPAESVEQQFFHGIERNAEALEYVQTLRTSCKVGLLANAGPGMIEGCFSEAELQQYFDVVVRSYEIKAAKPDPAVFRWTCEQLGVQPDEAVVIDDVAENCTAARAIGVQAVQYWDLVQAKTELEAIIASGRSALA